MTENLRIMKGEDYIKNYADLDLNSFREFSSEIQKLAKEKKENALRLKSIRAITRYKCDVVIGGIGGNTAAFINMSNKETFIGENTLANREFALPAAQHEDEHALNGVDNLPLERLSNNENKILNKKFKLNKNLDKIGLIEGFNEFSNFEKNGRNEYSAYAKKEVPLAEELEKLGKKYFQESFLETFRRGKKEEFVIMLKKLATRIQFEQVLSDLN